ncbi:barstar family protein [Streptomyces sp. NPDC093228]|jgi:RNAse (barnase) inhibitor barstar|uniref:barstar family protein n=1 Tax=unclassified Streptomyces TaxID=2593676 RepID=UPI000E27481B|nr:MULTISPECIES: barstar family protein [unclassified Streptomyces]MDX3259422.1 barstar family protein [Streptomyces sp. MI02-2A]REE59458.1 RNAse (barnase) inhibitor barstar [Streptomyces sp. 3212.3]
MTDDLADRLVVTLDLDTVDDKAAFMERIAGALGLPDWFGRNWDALADSLTDRTVWPTAAVGRGLLLVVRGWRRYATARPEEWDVALEVFSTVERRTPGLTVALALGGSHEGPLDLPG